MTDARVAVDRRFQLASTVVSLHEPVVAEVEIDNRSSSSVSIDLGRHRLGNLRLSVTRGEHTTSMALARESGIAENGHVVIAAKTSYRQQLVLNEWYAFDTEGDYAVRVQLPEVVGETAVDITVGAQPAAVSLRVVPRDPGRLQDVGATLTAVATRGHAEAAADAALAVSYLTDPIAVPYLEQLVKRRGAVQVHAIAGLGRIRSTEALELLRALTRDTDPDVAALARQALTSRGSSVMD